MSLQLSLTLHRHEPETTLAATATDSFSYLRLTFTPPDRGPRRAQQRVVKAGSGRVLFGLGPP